MQRHEDVERCSTLSKTFTATRSPNMLGSRSVRRGRTSNRQERKASAALFIRLCSLVAVYCSLSLGPMARAASPQVSGGIAHNTRMPGPWPARPRSKIIGDATSANARCEACHAEIAAEWRASYHAKAYSNAAFQRALAIEPLPFCKGCHAPEANPNLAFDTRLTQLGVGCVSCHVIDGQVLAIPADRRVVGHPVLRSARFASEAACANCHQFAFPGEPLASGLLMQSTVSEHAASRYTDVSCANCHMRRAKSGHADHRFNLARDAALLKAALSVQARRVGPQTVEVILGSIGVGHAFPTGDLFRRLEISAEAVGPEHSSMASAATYLTRRFVTQRAAHGVARRVLLGDDRLGAREQGQRVVQLELGPDASKWPIAWRVAYQRVEHPGKVGQPDAVLDGELELAQGVLAPEGTLPQEQGHKGAQALRDNP